jgi:hypothetical protein
MAEWEIWLDDPRGNRLKLVEEWMSASAVKVANGIGAVSLTLPATYDPYIRLDGIIEVWRKPDGGKLKLFNAYFIRPWAFADEDNTEVTEIGGPDGMYLPQGRAVAYAAGTTNADVTTYADDLLKNAVRQNMTTDCSDTDRDLSGIGLTVAPNLGAAPSISMAFSWRRLSDVFRDACATCADQGTNLYYDFVPVPKSDKTMGFDFRTYTNQPGQDLTGANRVIFGRSWGNFVGAREAFDHTDEITNVYALGRGLKDARVVEEVEDTARATASPWARRETSLNVSGQSSTTDAYVAAGQARLNELRPRLKISGTILDTKQARYMVDWDWGARVIVAGRYNEYEAIITAITISMDGRKNETIKATFEVQA